MTTLASRAARIVVLAATALSSPQFAISVLASDGFGQMRPVDRRVAKLMRNGVVRSRTIGRLLDAARTQGRDGLRAVDAPLA